MTTNSHGLAERAVLSTLRLGSYSGMKHDSEVTHEVAEERDADPNESGRYNKQIVARKFIRHVGKVQGVARRTHRILTLPWEDDGTRILAASGYTGYMETMRLQRLNVEAAAAQFVKGLPEYIKEAQVRLGKMFNADDYPTEDDLKDKFYLDVEIKKVPEAGDFRANLSDASVKAIVKDIERRGEERLEKAMDDVYGRVADVAEKLATKLREYKPVVAEGEKRTIIHENTVFNVKELADLIPALNLTDDTRLEQLRQRMLADLTQHSPEVLRSDERKRKTTAEAAEALLKKARQYMAA